MELDDCPQKINSNIHVMTEQGRKIILDETTTQWVCCDEEAFKLFLECDGKRTLRQIAEGDNKRLEILSEFEEKGLVFKAGKRIVRKPPDWPDKLQVSFATFMVSRDCNLDCRYCFAGGSQGGKIMLKETAHRILDKLFELPTRFIKIHWAGGEPLLGFDTIIEGTEYAYGKAKETRKELRFSLQTNGTLLTERKMKILNDLKIPIAISIDGPPELTDKQRLFPNGKGASQAILKGIKTALSLRDSVGSIVTVGSHNVEKIEEVMDFLHSIGIQSFKMNPCKPLGRAHSSKNLCPQPLSYLEAMLKAVDKAQKQDFEVTTLRKYISNLIYADRKSELCLSSPNCGAGIRMLCFDYNGDVYPCDEFLCLKEFNCGNIKDHSLQEIFDNSPAIQKLRKRNVDKIKRCRHCLWRHFCGGGCAASAYWDCGSLEKEAPYCEERKGLFESLIWRIVDDVDFASKYSDIPQ